MILGQFAAFCIDLGSKIAAFCIDFQPIFLGLGGQDFGRTSAGLRQDFGRTSAGLRLDFGWPCVLHRFGASLLRSALIFWQNYCVLH